MKKLSPKQKQNFREVLDALVADSKERASRREVFIEEMRVLLETLTGTPKVWLFKELERQRCKGAWK